MLRPESSSFRFPFDMTAWTWQMSPGVSLSPHRPASGYRAVIQATAPFGSNSRSVGLPIECRSSRGSSGGDSASYRRMSRWRRRRSATLMVQTLGDVALVLGHHYDDAALDLRLRVPRHLLEDVGVIATAIGELNLTPAGSITTEHVPAPLLVETDVSGPQKRLRAARARGAWPARLRTAGRRRCGGRAGHRRRADRRCVVAGVRPAAGNRNRRERDSKGGSTPHRVNRFVITDVSSPRRHTANGSRGTNERAREDSNL